MVSDAHGRRDGAVTPGWQPPAGLGLSRIRDALRRYGLWSLVRGLLLRRHFARCGVLAWRGGRPMPHIESRGTLVADSITLFPGVRLEVARGATLSIGKGTYLNRGVTVVCERGVQIGRNCAISWDVVIMDTDQHERPGLEGRPLPVVIEDDVWIGCRAIVLKGVTIGRGAVIGAGAIVTRDVPPFTVAVGQPARVVRTLPTADERAAAEAHEDGPASTDDEGQEQSELAAGVQ